MNIFYQALYSATEHPYWAFAVLIILGCLLTYGGMVWASVIRKGAKEVPLISVPFTLVIHLFFAFLLVATFQSALDAKASGSFNPLSTSLNTWLLLGPCMITSILGKYDDRNGLSSRIKLGAISALWVLLAGIEIIQHLPSEHESTLILSVMISHGLGLAINLALPLIDGINGLFAGASAVLLFPMIFSVGCSDCCSTFLSYVESCFHSGDLAIFMVPFLIGFLFFNLAGKVRMGETAVLPLAFLVAKSGIRYIEYIHSAELSIEYIGVIALIILIYGYPVIDFLLVLLFRRRNNRSLFSGGHDHLHHRLMQGGWSQRVCFIAIIFSLILPCLALFILKAVESENKILIASSLLLASVPMWLLFYRGYTKVNPYKSGAVDERGRP